MTPTPEEFKAWLTERLRGRDGWPPGLSLAVERIDATSQAVAAADRAYVTDEIGSVRWEWRGLLKRMTRRRRPRTS